MNKYNCDYMGRKRLCVCHRCGYRWNPRVLRRYVVCPSCRTMVKFIEAEKLNATFEEQVKELKIELNSIKKEVAKLNEAIKYGRKE
jgi:hypothetical protein